MLSPLKDDCGHETEATDHGWIYIWHQHYDRTIYGDFTDIARTIPYDIWCTQYLRGYSTGHCTVGHTEMRKYWITLPVVQDEYEWISYRLTQDLRNGSTSKAQSLLYQHQCPNSVRLETSSPKGNSIMAAQKVVLESQNNLAGKCLRTTEQHLVSATK